MRSTSLAQVCYALKQQFIQKPLRSSPLSFDRSELVCRRWVGKRIWLGRIRNRASPAEKFGEKTAKFHRLRELHLAGPRPLYFTQKNTRRTQKSTFPDLLPEWVWTADACHTSQPPAEKTQIYFKSSGWEGWVGLFGLNSQLFPVPNRCQSLPSFLPCFSGHAVITC